MKTKELMKGCGKDFIDIAILRICGGIYLNEIRLCPICKAKQSERLNCYREELRFLGDINVFKGSEHKIDRGVYELTTERINFLKQEIKDLDTLKGIKEKK